MPIEENKSLHGKVKLLILIFIFGLLFITLIYYLFLYFAIDKTLINDDASLYETVISVDGNERILKRQYSVDVEPPDFIVRYRLEPPSELEVDFDLFEDIGIRVVSTGKFSTTVIKDSMGVKKLAEVLQLEVYIDDKQGFLEKNEPFNIALKVYPAPNIIKDESWLESERERLIKELKDRDGNPREPTKEEIEILNKKLKVFTTTNLGKNIAPKYLLDIERYLESERLNKELKGLDGSSRRPTAEETEILNEKIRAYSERLVSEGIDQNMLEETYKEGTLWVMTPYYVNSKDGFVEYLISREYSTLLNEYYGGDSSALLSKILSKNVVGVKSPVLITDLFVNVN